jgi:hypothetical protein
MNLKLMRCADCDLRWRLFRMVGCSSEYAGPPDYSCGRCGWLQTSTAAGCAELCRSATWHDVAAFADYRRRARAGGFEVPDTPPRLIVSGAG